MREWDQVGGMVIQRNSVGPADDLRQFVHLHELGDGELAHRDQQVRLQQLKLCLQPAVAGFDLALAGDPVTPFGVLAGKTAAHSGHINPAAKCLLIQSNALEPLEHRLPGGPGKGFPQLALFVPRRLTDQHYLGVHGLTDDYGSDHVGAGPAGV